MSGNAQDYQSDMDRSQICGHCANTESGELTVCKNTNGHFSSVSSVSCTVLVLLSHRNFLFVTFLMPGLVAFGRRWSVGSDDIFVPCVSLCLLHLAWLVSTLAALAVEGDNISHLDECSGHLMDMMGTVIGLLFTVTILELTMCAISLRGSVVETSPRTSVEYLIYTRLALLWTEITWSGFALSWVQQYYFSCQLNLMKQMILGLMLCKWLILVSVFITVWCTFDVGGRSWIKMKRYQDNLKEMEGKYANYKRSGSQYRNWRQRKVIRAYQNSWNHRCRLLFCCIHRTEQNRDSFADLARLLSEFFRDLDVVPSDVIVGLLLLRRLQQREQCIVINERRNNTYEFLSGIAVTPATKFVGMTDSVDSECFHNVVYFMHYAAAAYGWPWYVLPNGVQGVRNLCPHLQPPCRSYQLDLSEVVVDDNCCYCNYAVIPTIFSESCQVVYATYHVDVGETAFFVVVDEDKHAIVVSIRGTLSLQDVLTDLNAEGEILPLTPKRDDWLGHKGMVQAAMYMKSKLLEEGILEKAIEVSKQYEGDEPFRIVLVGHSLGAGTAAILAILLRQEYENLECYAYSPPGGLLSWPVVEYTKEFVTSVMVGKDVVPRSGLSQMEALRSHLIKAIRKSQQPKWQIILSSLSCCRWLNRVESLPQDIYFTPTNEHGDSAGGSYMEVPMPTSMSVHQPLYPPGKIMHIVRHHPKKDEIKYESFWRRVVRKSKPVFQALWTENTDYNQVLISPGMIQDHMPDQVLRALNRVVTTQGPAKPSRSAPSVSPLSVSKESLPTVRNPASSHILLPSMTSVCSSETVVPDAHDFRAEEVQTPAARSSAVTFRSLNDLAAEQEYIEDADEVGVRRADPDATSYDSMTSDEEGSTFKEMFGTSHWADCAAPLASPETLSEMSFMSRSGFTLPRDRDQSPMIVRTKHAVSSSDLSIKLGKKRSNGFLPPDEHHHPGRDKRIHSVVTLHSPSNGHFPRYNGVSAQVCDSELYGEPGGEGRDDLLHEILTELNGIGHHHPQSRENDDDVPDEDNDNGNMVLKPSPSGNHKGRQRSPATTPRREGPYDPVYPAFTQQAEYGSEDSPPHQYKYSLESP